MAPLTSLYQSPAFLSRSPPPLISPSPSSSSSVKCVLPSKVVAPPESLSSWTPRRFEKRSYVLRSAPDGVSVLDPPPPPSESDDDKSELVASLKLKLLVIFSILLNITNDFCFFSLFSCFYV